MISMLITMCTMLAALWCVFYWSRERIFRLMVIISIALHGILFIPFGRVVGMGKSPTPSGPRLLNYTFVRGTSKEKQEIEEAKDEVKKEILEEKTEIPDQKINELAENTVSQMEPEKKSAKPDLKGDPDHPDTSDITWFAFDKHPTGESYSKELNRLINTNLEIPEEILKEGYEGKQVVFFKLSRKGELRAVFIPDKNVSSNPLVNETSIANIRRIAEKFPPLPDGVEEDEVWFHVEINYAK